MDSTIDVTFRYAEMDYVHAVRAHNASRLRIRLDIAVSIALFAFGAFVLAFTGRTWFGALALVVSIALAFVLFIANTMLPRYVFRSEPKFQDEYFLSFSPAGIHFRTANIDSQLTWSLYSHALVDDRTYLLYYGWRQFTVLPTWIFETVEKRSAFELLLKAHVPQIQWRCR